jgi:hypothetical protein
MNTKAKDTARPLNMDEKKKLEKVIYNVIDRAKMEYELTYNEKVKEVKAKAIRAEKVLKLVKEYDENSKEAHRIESELDKMGFSVSFNNNSRYDDDDDEDEDSTEKRVGKSRVYTSSYGNREIKEVKDIDLKKDMVNKKFDEMKRTYTLKLFAGGLTEAENVFAELAKELAKLLAF